MDHAASMDEALKKAMGFACPDDVVLLSPACSSFDIFHNYQDRGNQFKASVRALNLKSAST